MIVPCRRTLANLVLAMLVSSTPTRAAEEIKDKDIKAALASTDSLLRHNTWQKLNPENPTQYKILLQILGSLSWYDRDGAILALATAATEETLKKMGKDLKGHKDPAVRQGLGVALAKMDDEKFYPQLFDALKDKHPLVRRTLVYTLGITKKKKEKVEALIEAFQKEKDPVVRSLYVDALNSQTLAFQGPDPKAWFTWWEEAKADKSYELGKTDEEAQRKAEDLGNKLKKRTTSGTGVTLETEERGRAKAGAVPILIIPEYGHSKDTMVPFLAELELTHKLFYIDLPEIKSFKNLEVVSNARIPFYPIDQLVEAFEALRKATEQDRFAIMACGLNCWIAMRYASLHPESVSHMVLIGPCSSVKAYGDATDRMISLGKERNDVELWHVGLSRRFNSQTGESNHDEYHRKEKLDKPDGEDASLDRRNWSLYFRDERDSTISMLYPKMHRPLGGVAIPDFRCFDEPQRAIPTIVIAGRGSVFTSVQDCQEIAKHYNGVLYIYENSSMMPFCEESELFNKHMSALLRERPRPTKKAPKKKEKK